MEGAPAQAVDPIALNRDEGEALWFFGALATIKATGDATGGRNAILEFLSPKGAGSPLHVHRNEDEWFYITEGEVTFWVGGKIIKSSAGSFVFGPRGIPHTFEVMSPTARFLLVGQPAGFENFVRALGEPATSRTVPPPAVQLPILDRIMPIAARYGIEIVGPPGIPT